MKRAFDRYMRKRITAEQEAFAAVTGFVTDKHRQSRAFQPTHAIDNVDPSVLSDRDDGIYIDPEPTPEGHTRIHVTIADVAAHVPLHSPLGSVSHERAFTLYRLSQGMNDPMYPEELERRMSLEHGQERLGLDVIIDIDHDYKPVHTEFKPVFTKPDNINYHGFAERRKQEPQFQRLEEMGEKLRKRFLSQFEEFWEDNKDQEAGNTPLSSNEKRAMKTVETYMILANHCVAEFFGKTDIPILYRNFDNIGARTHRNANRAFYSVEWRGHKAMDGKVPGRYCHFTSPIRRGADYYNALAVHYVADAMQDIEQVLSEYTQKDYHFQLWQRAPEIAGLLYQMQQNDSLETRREFRSKLYDLLRETVGEEAEKIETLAFSQLASKLMQRQLGYTQDELHEKSDYMNELSIREKEIRRANHQVERLRAQTQWMRRIHGAWQTVDKSSFMPALRKAAQTGQLTQNMALDAIRRIRNGKSSDVSLPDAAVSIMLLAPYYHDMRWKVLKKEISKAIKHDNGIVKGVFEVAHNDGVLPKDTLSLASVALPVESSDTQQLYAALLVQNDPNSNTKISAPLYSIGRSQRDAETHALYSYLEHRAFGQLKPFDASKVPNLLYAKVSDPDVDRLQLIKQMVEEAGATIELKASKEEGGVRVVAEVAGGDFEEPVQTYAYREDEENAKNAVLEGLIRDIVFKQKVGVHQPRDMFESVNPLPKLETEVAEAGLELFHHIATHRTTRKKDSFEATVCIRGANERRFYQGVGPNRPRALDNACIQALRLNDWHGLTPLGEAKSWAAEVMKDKPVPEEVRVI